MIKLNGKPVDIRNFPDGTLLLKEKVKRNFSDYRHVTITWLFNKDEELVALIYLTRHLQEHGVSEIDLEMPYIPNARQDRVKNDEDVFTLKYFAQIINSLHFNSVTVLDPHSYVSEALIDNIIVQNPKRYVENALLDIGSENTMLFFPDEGAMKRYSTMFDIPYAFGIKKRDWSTGQIMGLDVSGDTNNIKGRTILIVDDISSRGGTFYFSAKKLKELGAGKIYLYVSHCEDTILDGIVLTSGLVERVYTTDSIFTANHEKVKVFNYE